MSREKRAIQPASRREKIMNTITTVKWAAALMLAATLTANAQGPGGAPQQGGPQDRPQGGNFQPPGADEIVKHMLTDFDADKDGKLDAAELKKSVEAHQQQRQQRGGPMGGPGGGQQGMRGGPDAGFQGGPKGERPEPPAPDKIAAKWMEEFDADKNGSLSKEELQKALEAHRPQRPQGGGPGGGQQGGPQGGPGR
jgi:hypothetical protein